MNQETTKKAQAILSGVLEAAGVPEEVKTGARNVINGLTAIDGFKAEIAFEVRAGKAVTTTKTKSTVDLAKTLAHLAQVVGEALIGNQIDKAIG